MTIPTINYFSADNTRIRPEIDLFNLSWSVSSSDNIVVLISQIGYSSVLSAIYDDSLVTSGFSAANVKTDTISGVSIPAGNNRVLLMLQGIETNIGANSATVISAASYGNKNFIKAARAISNSTVNTNTSEIWYLPCETSGIASSGDTQNVVVTYTLSAGAAGYGFLNLDNVKQLPTTTAAQSSTATTATYSLTISGVSANSIIVETLTNNSNFFGTPTSGQTKIFDFTVAANQNTIGAYKVVPSAGNYSEGWTYSAGAVSRNSFTIVAFEPILSSSFIVTSSVSPSAGISTYILSAYDLSATSNSISASVTVRVADFPIINYFSANPPSPLLSGTSTTLGWSVSATNSIQVSISQIGYLTSLSAAYASNLVPSAVSASLGTVTIPNVPIPAGYNRVLILMVGNESNAASAAGINYISSATYGTASNQFINAVRISGSNNTSNPVDYSEIWYLPCETVGIAQSGDNENVTIYYPHTTSWTGYGLFTISGVEQYPSVSASQYVSSQSAFSVTLTGISANSIIVETLINGDTVSGTPTAGQTKLFDISPHLSQETMGGYKIATSGGTYVETWRTTTSANVSRDAFTAAVFMPSNVYIQSSAITPTATSTVYILSAYNIIDKTVSTSAILNINAFNIPSVIFSANPSSIVSGASSLLNWIITSNPNCFISTVGISTTSNNPYQIPIALNNSQIVTSSSNFPLSFVLNSITDQNFWNNVQSNGGDLMVFDVNNNQLPLDIDYIDVPNKRGVIHFSTSNLLQTSGSSATDIFYLSFGNSALSQPIASGTYGKNNVWDSNFISVWHLSEVTSGYSSATGVFNDSTINAATSNLTATGINPSAVSNTLSANFCFGVPVDFPAAGTSAALVRFNSSNAINSYTATSAITIETLTNRYNDKTGSTNQRITSKPSQFAQQVNGGLQTYVLGATVTIVTPTNQIQLIYQQNAYVFSIVDPVNQLVTISAITQSGTNIGATSASTTNLTSNSNPVGIGNDPTSVNFNNSWKGWIDEFRMSKVARDSLWLSTTQNIFLQNSACWNISATQNSNLDLYNFFSTLSSAPSANSATVSPSATTTYVINVTNCVGSTTATTTIIVTAAQFQSFFRSIMAGVGNGIYRGIG